MPPQPGEPEMLFEPTGDLAKDYSAYCEIADRDERDDLLDGISTSEKEPGKTRTQVVVRNLEYCLNKRDAAPLTSAIPHCNTLTSVQLTSCGVTEHSYKLLVEALYKSPSVVSCSVDFNPGALFKDPTVSRKDKNDVVVLPSQFRGAHLRAPEPEVKDDGKKGKVDPKKAAAAKAAAAAAAAEEQNAADKTPIQLPTGWHAILYTGIQQLSLRGNDIGDKQVELMVPLLEKNADLLSLSLWGNVITDAGAVMLAGALTKNRRLTALNLGHNKFGDVGLAALARMLLTVDVSADEALVARQKVYPTEKELPVYPTYADLYAAAAAAAASALGEPDAKKDPKKKEPAKGKGKPEGPVERPRTEFDRDCVRIDDSTIRVPGMTSLWCINVSHNAAITAEGVKLFADVLRTREPDYDDASSHAEGQVPKPYCAGIALEKLEVDHPQLDAAAKKLLKDALEANVAARAPRGPPPPSAGSPTAAAHQT